MTDVRRDDASMLVHAYLDGELDPADAIALERRITLEPALAAERARIEMLRRVLNERLPPAALPPGLRQRIQASVGVPTGSLRTSWRAMAASAALGAVIAGSSTWALLQHQPRDVISDAIVASHMRGLMAPQPADVASSDRHTVKPWFNGRIPQAPRVVDLSGAGFPLVGGRLDVIERTPVPTLVYSRRKHLISLTAVPSAGQASPSGPRSIDGYNILTWTDNGVTYWATSDLNTRELGEFAAAFRAAP